MTSEPLTVVMDVSHGEYGPSAPAWEAQRRTLTDALRKSNDIGSVESIERPVEGTKGGDAELVIQLLSAAIPAFATIASAWLEKDKARKVKLRIKRGDEEIVVEGDALQGAALDRLVSKLKS